ncbi:hypothetical protein TNCV_1215891 [Trichonephila clavipes]|nr:hypothetical protein TNCV_1215891 [Trichonephila clavipes]
MAFLVAVWSLPTLLSRAAVDPPVTGRNSGKRFLERNSHSKEIAFRVTAATMADYQDLSEFERVGARDMGHSISEKAMKFGFSRTAISRVYHDSGKTSNL